MANLSHSNLGQNSDPKIKKKRELMSEIAYKLIKPEKSRNFGTVSKYFSFQSMRFPEVVKRQL